MPKPNLTVVDRKEDLDLHRALGVHAERAEAMLPKRTMQWYKHCIDPRSNKCVPSPGGFTGYVGPVEQFTGKARGQITTNSNGIAVLVCDPYSCAGCTDRAIAIATDGSSTLNTSSPIPSAPTTGVNSVYVANTSKTGAGFGGKNDTGSFYRATPNACAAYLIPTGAATVQNGEIYTVEFPGAPETGSVPPTITEAVSYKPTRMTRGVQTGDANFQNVAYWFRQAGQSQRTDDGTAATSWVNPSAVSTSIRRYCFAFIILGNSNTPYDYEIHASWLAVGIYTNPNAVQLSDVLGYQMIKNAMAHKSIDGWAGKPDVNMRSHQSALVAAHNKVTPNSEVQEQKARAALDKKKAQKASNGGGSSWWDSIMGFVDKALPIASSIAGFLI